MKKAYIKKNDSTCAKLQILAVYKSNGDYKKLASELNISRATLYRWIKSDEPIPDKRGGSRGVKITEEHRNFLVSKIEENPRITLIELKNLLCVAF